MRKGGAEGGLTLAGRWLVLRESGALLPFGITKRIRRNGRGWTCLFGVPLFPFRVTASAQADREFRYRLLPIRDELVELELGQGWAGRALIFGREFCRFRMLPAPR